MRYKPPTVLVVDDEPVSRTIVCAYLERVGLPYIQASSGSRALSLLEDNRDIGLLILDLQMPQMGGRDLLTHVRALSAHVNTPIILMSGVVRINEIYDLIEDPKVLFLPKPIDFTYLGDYLRQLLAENELPKKLLAHLGVSR